MLLMVPNITGRFSSWLGGTAGMGVGGGGREIFTKTHRGADRK